MPTNINGFGVITSSTDKAKVFAEISASSTTLDKKDHTFPDFSHLIEYRFSNNFITPQEVKIMITSLDPKKATSYDKIPVAVNNNSNPDLSDRSKIS